MENGQYRSFPARSNYRQRRQSGMGVRNLPSLGHQPGNNWKVTHPAGGGELSGKAHICPWSGADRPRVASSPAGEIKLPATLEVHWKAAFSAVYNIKGFL